jgi:hypothetical protein
MILPDIISEQQSAFVPRRLITDNALIAFECLHTIRNQKSKRPFFALKIDMMKAYDRVEWNYLHGCLSKLGFDSGWIQSVMRCVTCVRYAVWVNGELTEPVVPSRGIRQGDPISPYLFLLCTEGLSSMLQQREDRGELYGIRNGQLGPRYPIFCLQMIVSSLLEVILGVWLLLRTRSRLIVRALDRE